jgi:beta-aspartyl-peptidase (threonine type)
MNQPKIIVHGGAWDIPAAEHEAHLAGVQAAVLAGNKILQQGGDAVAAVLAAVRAMEADPTFDAAYGSFLNMNAEVEMDAIIMEGKGLTSGAVAAIRNVAHPVDVAELVRTQSPHCLLVAAGAEAFAAANGVPFIATENLLVGRELERYRSLKGKKNFHAKRFFEDGQGRDTVGAVAIDRTGLIAAATSTGGTPNKLPGRVGDSPIIGSGAYADNSLGGASATGWGESLMRVVLSKTCLDFLGDDVHAGMAARKSIQLLHEKVDGRGGVIVIDPDGNAAFAFNTPYMARAIADSTGLVHVGIAGEENQFHGDTV